MAPFKSTQSFSVGSFLKTFRNRDAVGPAALNSPVISDRGNYILNVPSGVAGPGLYDLVTSGRLLLAGTGTYDISIASGASPFSVKVHIWGAGGGSGFPQSGPGGGGAGGFTVGDHNFAVGTTYKYVVGSSDGTPGNPGYPTGAGSNGGYGGGYSGIFSTSISQSNAILIAGGGGGGGGNDNSEGVYGSGGGGGGATAQAGYRPGGSSADGAAGTQSAGGAGGSGSNPAPNGAALQGGTGGVRGGSGAGGGGGGSGYFGGGGGAGFTGTNSGGGGGGGGSGHLHPSLATNGTTTTATGNARITTSPFTPIIPATASKGNTETNGLSLPATARGGSGCIVIEGKVS